MNNAECTTPRERPVSLVTSCLRKPPGGLCSDPIKRILYKQFSMHENNKGGIYRSSAAASRVQLKFLHQFANGEALLEI